MLYELLDQLNLNFEEGGYPGHQDEATLIIGVAKNFHDYVQPFSLEDMATFDQKANALFTRDKLQVILDLLGLTKKPEFNRYILSSYS